MSTLQFTKFFDENPPAFKEDSSCKFRISGRVWHDYSDIHDVGKVFSPEVILKYDLSQWYKLNNSDKLEFVKNFIEQNYREGLAERRERRIQVDQAIKDKLMDLPSPKYMLDYLQPCRIIGDHRKEGGFLFLDKRTETITDYDYHSVFYTLTQEVDEKTAKRFINTIAHVRVEYNPYEDFKLKKLDDSNNVYVSNTFEPAHWRKLYGKVEAEYDEDIKKLIEHIFPGKDDRAFVFSWLYHSLTTRAGTYLYLCGGQGSGKNTFAKLCEKLHGPHNYSSPKQDSLKNRFNLYLKDKRFVFFDEFNCRGRQDKDILKSIINDRLQIEGKGADHADVEIHASYLIANNSIEAIGLDPVDRRFSVPDISHQNIIEVYSREWVRDLIEKLNDEKIIASFAKYILEGSFNIYSSEEPYQGTRFEEIVMATARMGISETLDKVLKGEQLEYDYHDEKDEYSRTHRGAKYPSIQDWQKFFRDARVGGSPIGIVRGKIFTPCEAYLPGNIDSDDLV